MQKLDNKLSEAIRYFWETRERQEEAQGRGSGLKDSGRRAAVTGGKHGNGFINLIAAIIRDAGILDSQIFINSTTLPCFYRPTKNWDLVVKVGNDLLAVIEVKAHVGSFGNNFNNRVEEALGNATDFWAAYSNATYKPSARPWLGYLMMLEEAPGSVKNSKVKKLKHYPMRDEFQGVSYAQRYVLLCEKLVRERLYDATCLVMSNKDGGLKGIYSEPSLELAFKNFAISLKSRARAFASLKS